MVVCLKRGADLHTAQLMPLPLTVSCFSKIQINFTFLVPAHPGSPGERAVKRVCVCVCVPSSQPSWRYVAAGGGAVKRDNSRDLSLDDQHVGVEGCVVVDNAAAANQQLLEPTRARSSTGLYTDTSTLRSRVLFQPASYGRVVRFPPTKCGRCLSISSSMLTRQGQPTPTVYCTYIQWRNVTMGWLLRLMTGCPTGGRGPPTVLF